MPIVEPEILPDGDHDLQRCQYVTEKVRYSCLSPPLHKSVANTMQFVLTDLRVLTKKVLHICITKMSCSQSNNELRANARLESMCFWISTQTANISILSLKKMDWEQTHLPLCQYLSLQGQIQQI